MSIHEELGEFSRPSKLEKKARQFCRDIQRALELFKQLKDPATYSEELRKQAFGAAESLVHGSVFGVLPFRLLVTVPEGVYAHISRNMDILDEHPTQFEANEVRRLDTERIEFHDSQPQTPNSDKWLVVYGHNVQVVPILPPTEAPSE